MKKIYNKLVRDKIIEIIHQDDKHCTYDILSKDECIIKLEEKLSEELEEYLASKEIEELADLQEVIYALIELKGYSKKEFEAIRLMKVDKRGAFNKRILLKEVNK